MAWLEDPLAQEARVKSRSRRRSRLEMTCDVLRVISQGIEKPTRIMQISNITWKDLLSYIETLLENQFITREVNGSRVEYRLTAKGQEVLELYIKLREATTSLNLDEAFSERAGESTRAGKESVPGLIVALTERLTRRGYSIEGNVVTGRSGGKHTFDVVARRPEGSRVAYVVSDNVTKEQVVGLFVSQLDTDLSVCISCSTEPSEESRRMAENFSIAIETPARETA